MSEPVIPDMNCAHFMLPYPEEVAKKTGSAGMVFSIREHYLLHARQLDDTDPQEAAVLRKIADYHPDTFEGDIMERDSRDNWVGDANDWDDLTDEQKIHRGNTNAAIAALDWLRNELEKAAYYYEMSEDVTRVRREIAAIAL
ncbi:hypothetical protein [Rhizobiales bacterium]|uniref:hypothetical protein n=1 Tax=Ensifer sp. R-19 TaxID=3404055 RepID=UPI0013B031A0